MKSNQKVLMAVCLAAALLGTACGSKEETGAEPSAQAAAEAQSEQTPETITPVPAETTTAMAVDGIVLDAAMNSMEIQTTEGLTLEFAIEDASNVVDLKDGLLIGIPVNVAYTGTIEGTNTGNITILKVTESKLAPSLSQEQLSFAADIILTVQAKDLNLLAEYTAYPVYIGIGEGKEIASKEEFLDLNADEIFTGELVEAVSSINLFEITEVKAGIVLGDAKPNIIFSEVKGEFGICGINY